MLELNKIHNGNCINLFKELPDNIVDLICSSPPYNVNVSYDTHKDDMPMEDYFNWCKEWLKECYRTLKPDGRIALNVPMEVNVKERGGRYYMASEFWQMMKETGFGLFGIVDLEEESPHRPKNTAGGSWMSPSSPYIYNPKECVILAYKKDYKKNIKGLPEWSFEDVELEDEKGEKKMKRMYTEEDKREFMDLVFGRWKYFADTQSYTKATFSLDIPMKAIKILTYKGEIVLDPFSGSGTTCLAAKKLGRNYLGFELSENYTEISRKRISEPDSVVSQDTLTLYPQPSI